MTSHRSSNPSLHRAFLIKAAIAATTLLGSCGQQAANLTSEEAALLREVLALVEIAPTRAEFDGERLVERFEGDASTLVSAHTERVQTDGEGGFSIEPLEVIHSGAVLGDQFLVIEDSRAGWNWRYRDFRIHDVDAVLENYTVLDFGELTEVAGRPCYHLEVAKVVDPFTVKHAVDVDLESGLVLRHEVLQNSTLVRYRSEYTSIAYDTGAPFAPHGEHAQFESFDSLEGLSEELGFEVRAPRVTLDGFSEESFGRLSELSGEAWGMIEYTDGIEALFFLTRRKGMESLGEVAQSVTASDGGAAYRQGGAPGTDTSSDLMVGLTEGALSILQADLGD